MKKIKLFLILTLIFCFNYNAEAQTGAITVSTALSKLDNLIQDAISNASYEIQLNSFAIYSEANVTIDNFRIAYSDMLNKTFSELNATEKQIFDDLNLSIQNLERGIKNSSEQVINNAYVRIQQISDQLPFRKKNPKVYRYSHSIFATCNTPNDLILNIDGVNLFKQKPFISIGNNKYDFAGNTNSIQVNIPNSHFTNNTGKIKTVNANLTLYKKKRNKKKKVNYDLKFFVLPDKIGSFKIAYDYEIEVDTIRKKESQIFRHKSAKSSSYKSWHDRIYPSEGWKIYMDTPPIANTNHCYKCRGVGIVELSSNGFAITSSARGRGAPSSYRGAVDVSAVYYETKKTKKIISKEINSNELLWSNQKSFDLPKTTLRWTIIFDSYDGKHYEINTQGNQDRFKVIYSNATKQISVSPFNTICY